MAQRLFGSYYLNVPPPVLPAGGLKGLSLTPPYDPFDIYSRWAQPILTPTEPPIDTTVPLDPVAIAVKVNAGQTLTAQEQAVWNAQSATAKALWLNMARATAIPAGSPAAAQAAAPPSTTAGLTAWLAGSTALFGTTVKNSYLAAGAGVAVLAVLVGKKGRR